MNSVKIVFNRCAALLLVANCGTRKNPCSHGQINLTVDTDELPCSSRVSTLYSDVLLERCISLDVLCGDLINLS